MFVGLSWVLCKIYLVPFSSFFLFFSLSPVCGQCHQKIFRGHPRPAPSLYPPPPPAQILPVVSRADEQVWAPCPGTLVLLGREQLWGAGWCPLCWTVPASCQLNSPVPHAQKQPQHPAHFASRWPLAEWWALSLSLGAGLLGSGGNYWCLCLPLDLSTFPCELAGRCLFSMNPYSFLSLMEVCSLRDLALCTSHEIELCNTDPSHHSLSPPCLLDIKQGLNVRGDPWGMLMEMVDYRGLRIFFFFFLPWLTR